MENLVDVVGYVNIAAFVALAVVTFKSWRARGDEPGRWAFLTFACLAVVAVAGEVLPETGDVADVSQKFLVAVLLLFPYFLFLLASSFTPRHGVADRLAALLTLAVIVWGFLIPSLPAEGDPRSTAVSLFIVGILVQWVTLSAIVAMRFWKAGHDQPVVSKRRMRVLSIASIALSIAIVIAGAAPTEHDPALDLIVQLLALASIAAFFFAFAPPRWLRTIWRRPAQEDLRRAAIELMSAETDLEVATRVLPHARGLVGSEGIALINRDGEVIARHGLEDDDESLRASLREAKGGAVEGGRQLGAGLVAFEFDFGSVVIRTSRYTLVFGVDEVELLGVLGALATLALERVRAAQLRWQVAQSRLRRKQALEINDNIVQGLTVAQYAFFMGENEKGMQAIEGTLEAARQIITDLMEESAQAGSPETSLVRDQPATGFTEHKDEGSDAQRRA